VVSYNATTFYDRNRTLQGVFAAARDVVRHRAGLVEFELLQARNAGATLVDEAVNSGAEAIVLGVADKRHHGFSIQAVAAGILLFCALLAAAAVAQEQDQKNDKTSPPVWTVPDINALPDDAAGRLVRHGATSLP